MAKRVIIVQQWGSSPNGDWYPWLASTLKSKGFDVTVPEMPDPAAPTIESWVSTLSNSVKPDSDTYFVGHSVGCQTILRYLEGLQESVKIGGVVLVAPWLVLNDKSLSKEEMEVARPWLETKIDWDKVKAHTNRFVVILALDDPYVPIANTSLFSAAVGAKIVTQPLGGHFEKSNGFSELHVALNELEKLLR
jgi:predicted alpha/beta hydrolase family esterase